MAFPVKVYKKHPDEGGKVRRIISTRMLEKRSDLSLAIALKSGEFTASFIPEKLKCPECGRTFVKVTRGQKYCSKNQIPYCQQKAHKRKHAERQRGYRVAKKKEKA